MGIPFVCLAHLMQINESVQNLLHFFLSEMKNLQSLQMKLYRLKKNKCNTLQQVNFQTVYYLLPPIN